MKTRYKKTTYNKLVSTILIVALLVCGIFTFAPLINKHFGNKPPIDLEESFNDLPMDGNGNIMGDGVHEMPQNLIFRSASQTSAQSDGITLTAIVKPTTATNKKVSWTIAFVNPSSIWATGKTVTNYVTVTPIEVGSPTATVRCVTGFSEKIKIVVSSMSNVDIKAECVVDFANRLTSASLKIKSSLNNTFIFEPNKITTVDKFYDMPFAFDMAQNASTYTFGEGTLVKSELDTMAFTLDSFSGANQRWSLFPQNLFGTSKINYSSKYGITLSPFGLGFAYDDYIYDPIDYDARFLEICNQVYRESNTDITKCLFKLTYTVSCKYYAQTFTSYMKIGSDSYFLVTDIELGNGSIIF